MKKRIIPFVLMMCLAVSLGLTGCGSDNPYSGYDLSEYVKTADYKGLEMEKIEVSVSDEEVSTQVEANVEDTKTTEEVKEGTVAKNDTVNIDYEGKIDGKTFTGGSAEDTDLTIGSGQFIDGFEDGLIGKPVGSTQTLNLKFPDDYNSSEVAGKDVVFTVTINHIVKETIPEYNDAWVADNSDVKTTAEYEQQVREELYKEKEEQAKSDAISDLWSQVVESSEVIKYPEDEVNKYVEEIEAQYQAMADNNGMELKDLWEQYGIKSEKEYNTENKETAQAYVKEQMVMYDIAEKEDLSYTDEEEDELRTQLEDAGYQDDESFAETFGQDMDTYIELALTFNKVGEFIFDNAKVAGEEAESTKETQSEQTTETTQATEATQAEPSPEEDMSQQDDAGADDATSNDQPGGADA